MVGRPRPPLPFPAALTGRPAQQNLNSITAPGIEVKRELLALPETNRTITSKDD